MNPIIELNKKSWRDILETLHREVISIANKRNLTPAEVTLIAKQYSSVLDENLTIFHEAVTGITKYTNSYRILPHNGVYDEFKNIYFLGMAITRQLDGNGLVDLSEIHQLAVLRLLDLRLLKPHEANRENLTSRMVEAIKNKSVHEHFGLYGWYLTYKCLYNAAEEAAGKKTTPL